MESLFLEYGHPMEPSHSNTSTESAQMPFVGGRYAQPSDVDIYPPGYDLSYLRASYPSPASSFNNSYCPSPYQGVETSTLPPDMTFPIEIPPYLDTSGLGITEPLQSTGFSGTRPIQIPRSSQPQSHLYDPMYYHSSSPYNYSPIVQSPVTFTSAPTPPTPPQPPRQVPRSSEKPARNFSCEDCGNSFTRHADVRRHQKSVHRPVLRDCPHPGCSRKGGMGFPRLDHMTEHLRSYHHQNIPKRGSNSPAKRAGTKRKASDMLDNGLVIR